MGWFDYRYLSEQTIKGFDSYKVSCERVFFREKRFFLQYNSLDNSPISVYISHPFWNQVVKVRYAKFTHKMTSLLCSLCRYGWRPMR